MLHSGADGQMAIQQSQTDEMVRFKRQMDGLKKNLGGDGDKDKSKKLHDACEKFEAVFISKLWQEMRKTVPKEGMMHGKQEEQYLSMFDRDFAEKMSASGGIGLADLIYDQLSEKLKNTSRSTLEGGVPIKPLHEDPIALQLGREPISLPQKQESLTLEDWGGHSGTDLSEAVPSSPESGSSASQAMSDVEVKAQLETLVRHLEAERIKSGLLGSNEAAGAYGQKGKDSFESVGRKIAKNG
ncbi:rod-binding protein [Pseudodesulfovibrio sp.]|uniref:rod-binding protein n=1 Tax=unclassified Pseudodesulfovibrio TaxID=2661612 RepID=UPI003AFFFA8C